MLTDKISITPISHLPEKPYATSQESTLLGIIFAVPLFRHLVGISPTFKYESLKGEHKLKQ